MEMKMEKIYKSKYKITNTETYLVFGIPVLTIFLSIPLIMNFKRYWPILIFIIIMFSFLEFVIIICSKVTVVIKDDRLIWKCFDKTVHVLWNEIKKVERLWAGYGGISYYIVTKKGRLSIPQNIENYQDILKEIKERTGKGVKWGL